MAARRKKKARKPRFCFANVSMDEAIAHGDCYFCGKPLGLHQPIRLEKIRTREIIDPLTGELRLIDELVERRFEPINKHHITWGCLQGQLEEQGQWPPDYKNVVWVGRGCHDRFHTEISQEFSPKSWTLELFRQVLEPKRYGKLYFADR